MKKCEIKGCIMMAEYSVYDPSGSFPETCLCRGHLETLVPEDCSVRPLAEVDEDGLDD